MMNSAKPIGSKSPRRMLILPLGVFVVISALAAGRDAVAQIDLADEGLHPGLLAQYTGGSDSRAARVDQRISFVWQADSPDPRIDEESFKANWSGYLMTQSPGQYKLSVYAVGRVRIKLAGKVVLDQQSETPCWMQADAIELPFDWHPLEVDYEKTGPFARISMFWQGPGFQREPVGERWFYHDSEKTCRDDFERGQKLVRALRCSACHTIPAQDHILRAPALDRLAGNVSYAWLVDWLSGQAGRRTNAAAHPENNPPSRRMPHFGLSRGDAEQLAKYLLRQSNVSTATNPRKSGRSPKADSKAGRELLMTVGCLACHQFEGLGTAGLFDGGDLTHIADKRPKAFFANWLANPAELNRRHRMPVFSLTTEERLNLGAFLATCKSREVSDFEVPKRAEHDPGIELGRQLFAKHRCFACHELSDDTRQRPPLKRTVLSRAADWSLACIADTVDTAVQPHFQLDPSSRAAVRHYLDSVRDSESVRAPARMEAARQALVENNCLSCHARGLGEGLAPRVLDVAHKHSRFESIVPAMIPPSLSSVGDKLNDLALADSIRRATGVHRPWLEVRMPKFAMPDSDLEGLVHYFSSIDRIPDDAGDSEESEFDEDELRFSGARLVTTAGFGCTSCHQIGNVEPPDAPLNARGPDLSQLGKRIRRQWYDRWVRDPARIVPGMEMPSVQLAVTGVLRDQLDEQLSAVWHVLNQPGFQPPRPNPVRIVRRSGLAERVERAAVLTDIIQMQDDTFVKPILIGLRNRHNVLLDLETNRLSGWWVGDTARQRTQGKSWYWEAAGTHLLAAAPTASELALNFAGKVSEPLPFGQFATEADQWRHTAQGIELKHRLRFRHPGESSRAEIVVQLVQEIRTLPSINDTSGFIRTLDIRGLPPDAGIHFRVLDPSRIVEPSSGSGKRSVALSSRSRIVLETPASATFTDRGDVSLSEIRDGHVTLALRYETTLPVDRFPVELPGLPPPTAERLDVIPGFEVTVLPIADQWMPTAMAWRPDGTLIVSSLKGQVWLASDTDGDGLENEARPFSDELAAPFGVSAGDGYVDVVNKYALLRMFDDDGDQRVDRTVTLASGWGYTNDYHDWTVGLPRDEQGNYYVATSCQQDDRSPAAAYLRGTVIRLSPRTPSLEDPKPFRLDRISGGHRFPMGIARSTSGELFVTDNQGNYNPFNELNHVRQDASYGFINKMERNSDAQVELTPPAINLPHPWTRSVNGICFLETPRALLEVDGRSIFGAFEGHLIGCEYDTRRLIRMSLQRIGDTYQGAAYPFSYNAPRSGSPLLGPLTCAVAPDGDLYVGSIRDSGWGGANNIGSLVRIKAPLHDLPPGIAEVRARRDGFEIRFTSAIDAVRATDESNYSISSYRRISTPAYGGFDVDRRAESIRHLATIEDGSIRISLEKLQAGRLYEFQLKNLSPQQATFFPAEAYYTLNRIPD